MLINLGQQLNQNKEKVTEIQIIRIRECATTSSLQPSPQVNTDFFVPKHPTLFTSGTGLVLIEKDSSKLGISKPFL